MVGNSQGTCDRLGPDGVITTKVGRETKEPGIYQTDLPIKETNWWGKRLDKDRERYNRSDSLDVRGWDFNCIIS